MGVFTQKDPWEGDWERPQSLNGWAYVEGNPIKFTDPLGLRGIISWGAYYLHWGNRKPDIINELGGPNTNLALGAIEKIELNFQGNPSYEGLPEEVVLVAALSGSCIQRPISTYLEDINKYRTQSYFPNRDYNRYDWLISGWVDYWNWRARREGKPDNLDPNFVKAFLYKETNMGYNLPPASSEFVGVGQLGQDAIEALAGSANVTVTWGTINVADPNEPS